MHKIIVLSLLILVPQITFCAAPALKQAQPQQSTKKSLFKTVKQLVEEEGIPLPDVRIQLPGNLKVNPLAVTAITGDPDLMEYIEQHPQDMQKMMETGDPIFGHRPLFLAVTARQHEMTQKLVDSNANVDHAGQEGGTALDKAAKDKDVVAINIMLPHAAPETIVQAANVAGDGNIQQLLLRGISHAHVVTPAVGSGKNTKKNAQKREKRKERERAERDRQNQQQDAQDQQNQQQNVQPLVSDKKQEKAKKQEKIYRKHEQGDYAPKPEEEEFLRQLERQMPPDPHGSSDEVKQ